MLSPKKTMKTGVSLGFFLSIVVLHLLLEWANIKEIIIIMVQKNNNTNEENNQTLPTMSPRIRALASATLARLRAAESSDRQVSNDPNRPTNVAKIALARPETRR
jgi:hypothetical protein